MHDNLHRARTRHSPYEEALDLYGDYSRLKARSEKEIGLSWSVDLSYLQQWGRPGGGSPDAQMLATPGVDWVLFHSRSLGEGSLQFAYTAARYPTSRDAGDVQAALGLATPINDFPSRQNVFAQLSYTHAFPGNSLLVSFGQYPFSNFDGNQYLNNQQQNFNNFLFAQNGSQTYPNAGLGAYVQANLTSAVQFAAGFQSAANITAANLSVKGFGDGGFAWFGYAQWTPGFRGMGTSQYSLTYYQVPSVPQQARSTGWSLNAVQNLDSTWAVFARANRAYDFVAPIRGSYVLGGAMNNPLGRSPTDQIGLAFGHADAAPPPTLPPGARDEKIVEAYWNWTLAKALLLTPDVQYIRDPALDPTRTSAWVWSLRATLMF
ncbi:MAG TPA: carbohydrate porin [Burkholderiales bacterium]